ncbi:Polysaccharide synthesis/modification protein [Pseudomonas syringae pv. philadelphi]|uniref:Polysaccharide synthesis/modification protein n=1 Tax=Pseudomonas syringae pv. philadelphi TaxID=251706 RepID=A0A3M3Y7Z8_9PSED|nr:MULTISPECIES: capsular biosynthesis protein [Pseudomonas syringae group]RMO78470.1 Polysaccharide synthesis/modification protein [Pseudomonas syringae pv. philadelphi]SDW97324.1 capsular polysaccharide export protein [Pseudomonas syringae]SFM11447.1 capsular polysaccharide export protein [Pseudomonas syringae]
MTMLFLSMARHQGLYFNRLLNETELSGRVVTSLNMSWPRASRMAATLSRIDFDALVEEKCEERRIKNKSAGYLYRRLLRLELTWAALRIQALLDRERPDAVGVWNGAHRYCRLLIALAPPECKTFFFENGLLPNTTTVDPKGVNYLNSMPRDPAFYLDYPYPVAERAPAAVLVPRKPRSRGPAPIKLPERFIFIPFQDDRDTQVRLFSPWVGNMREMFAVGERLAAETGMTVVFKEHPSSRESYPDLHKRASKNVLFANGNATQQLIEASQFVVTLNSTVGLESLLLGKPVMTLGKAFYNIDGLVRHAENVDQAVAHARAFPDWSLDERLRRNFLHYLSEHYCIKGDWRAADRSQLRRVANRLLGKSGC